MSVHACFNSLAKECGDRNVPFSEMHGGKFASVIIVLSGSESGSLIESILESMRQNELSKTLQQVDPFHLLSCQGTLAERCLIGKVLIIQYARFDTFPNRLGSSTHLHMSLGLKPTERPI
jgi:hypothetical protein